MKPINLIAFLCAVSICPVALGDDGPVNLGMVGIQSSWGRYLQAHSDNGETHASNQHRNEEETWFLIQVDAAQHIYALSNWSNGKFLSKLPNSCARAVSTVIGKNEEWRLESGKPYGVQNAVVVRSVADNTILGTGPAGHDDKICGGEVTSRDNWGPTGRLKIPVNDAHWGGWWVFSPATTPSPGRNVFNTVGGAVAGIANKISPADVAAVVAALM